MSVSLFQISEALNSKNNALYSLLQSNILILQTHVHLVTEHDLRIMTLW